MNVEIRMQTRCLAILLFSLFVIPGHAGAATVFIIEGKIEPVQVHSTAPAIDRNPVHKWRYPTPLGPSAQQADQSRTEASTTGFQPPLRRGLSNNNARFMHIAAFVDHDELMPDSLLDWDCGERTYDAATFNHNGTDYNTGPYPWLTMANDGVAVVAVADGEIIDKTDGEPDQNCAFNPANDANKVVLRHDNNKVSIYAHMKTGSVTPRKIGDKVEQGDYLGIMGSSGLSTGPHLHLGVQDLSNKLFDPYAGTCNLLNNESLWEDQEEYREQEILTLATHSAAPEVPPCPQLEIPHFKDVFAASETVFASITVRDIVESDEIFIEVIDAFGVAAISSTYSNDVPGFTSALQVTFGFPLSQSPPEGEYVFRATYDGKSLEHKFYVGVGPDPAPEATPANNAFTGLWYDPALDGEGFNIVTADGGTIIYFYGSDDRGNRVWLISDLIPGEIQAGITVEALMYESSGGVFTTPVPSARGLSIWGTLNIVFSACNAGQSTLIGQDGTKVSQIIKLAGISGASCVEGDVPSDTPWAGLWYDPSKDGEGYNLIISPIGRILYFYGFKASGLRLWLVSELVTTTLEVGLKVVIKMFESTQGTFSSPVPSGEALVEWGNAEITVIDCDTIKIVISGTDGSKTSNTVRLAGIIGSSCT